MKRNRIFVWMIAVSVSLGLGVPSGQAQEIYRAFVSQVCITSNASGGLVYTPFGNRDFIRKSAREQGVTNLAGLSLVFNRTANALQVVSGTNHVLLCTPLSFSGGQSLSNSNGTKVERLEFVFADGHTMADGTLKATERTFTGGWGTNQFSAFQLTGRLQYAVPAAGTNGPAIYSGSIFAGSLFGFVFNHDSDREFD
jgi:hypothetical protein